MSTLSDGDGDVPRVALTVSRPRPGVIVVAIRGDLDLATHAIVRACLDEQRRDEGLDCLVIDLTEVNFLQSAGIAVLADTQQSLPAHQQLALLGVNDNRLVRHVLDLVGILPKFTRVETIDELVGFINPTNPTKPTPTGTGTDSDTDAATTGVSKSRTPAPADPPSPQASAP